MARQNATYSISTCPDCDEPTPLVIYIHDDGFTGGDKSGADSNAADIRECLQDCVACSEEPAYPLTDPSGEGLTSFLLRHIQ